MNKRFKRIRFDVENTWDYNEVHLLPALSVVLDNGVRGNLWYAIQGAFLIWRFELSYS